MEPIRTQTTLSPHITKGTPRGYYALVQGLFPNGAPILRKDQFVGFNGSLIVTVARHNTWDTLMHMAVYARELNGDPVSWMNTSKLYPMPKGFRIYIPGSVLKPPSADAGKVSMTGIFRRHVYGGDVEPLYYFEFPLVGADVLLRRKRLGDPK